MSERGWFRIPGVQDGARTLDEQLKGLGPLFERLPGAKVLDLGCAEGLIAQACLQAGAERVVGMDNNVAFVERAHGLRLDPHRATFCVSDLNEDPDEEDQACCHSDIVLMLAILHKLRDPERSLRLWAEFASRWLVIRLPSGSEGIVTWKHGSASRVDTREALPQMGFELAHDLEGPRGERVHHWKRVRH